MADMGGFVGLDKLKRKFRRLQTIADDVQEKAAPAICEVMRTDAVDRITVQRAIRTGNLRNSINTNRCEFVVRPSKTTVEMGISTGVKYAPYIEFGTGPLRTIHLKDGGTRTITVKPRPARPFMIPALHENVEVFGDILSGVIKEAFE